MPPDVLVLGCIAVGAVVLALVAARSLAGGRADSALGAGTRFTVSLPIAKTRSNGAEARWSA